MDLAVEVEANAPQDEIEELRRVLAEYGIEGAVEPTRVSKGVYVEVVLVLLIGRLTYKTLSEAAKAFGQEVGKAAGEAVAPKVKQFCERLIGARERPGRQTPPLEVEVIDIRESIVIEEDLPLQAYERLVEGDVPEAPKSRIVRYDRTEQRWRADWDRPDIPEGFRDS
ncbi:MAG TPA: hypothetical protein VEH29_03555 [Acidimicrobiales bacterium]|nr:hypothetical protein [Acidimicrobiales bacterium]